MPDATVAPRTTVLLRGTHPDYHNARADTTTEKMGLIMIPVRSTFANGWVICTTVAYDADPTHLGQQEIAIRELDMINPQTTIPYDKDAETLEGDVIVLHYLTANDEHWALSENTIAKGAKVITHDDGSLQVTVDGGTDAACHRWTALTAASGAAWFKVKYLGNTYGTTPT